MMRLRFSIAIVAWLVVSFATSLHSQLQEPTPPVNVILDAGMAIDADDVGGEAVLWGLADRGEVNVLALICSSANDYSAPTMRVIATYYGYPNVPIGANKASTPNAGNSSTSVYTKQIVNQFGTPGDTRFNYPDAVSVYRQALANAPDNSVYIVADGYYEPLRDLLQSQPDAISPMTGMQLVTQKVRRLVSNAGWFPSGGSSNFVNDTDAASYVFTNWPGEIVSVGVEATYDVITGPSTTSNPSTDPVMAAYTLYQQAQGLSSPTAPAFAQIPLLYAIRGGLGTNFSIGGYNGQTTIDDTNDQFRGQNFWSATPNMNQSYLEKAISAAQMAAIINPLLQSSSNMPILRSISPTSILVGSPAQNVTLNGTNFFADSQVTVNGSGRSATFVNNTQLTVALSASDLSQVEQLPISVSNASEGGWTSNIMNLAVTAGTPTLSSISPSAAVAGSGPTTITAAGSNFMSNSVIEVNGAARNTTVVSSSQLSTTFTSADLSTAGSLSITVFTPGGGSSSPLSFTVNDPTPSLSTISPANAVAGSSGFTLTVGGSNFVAGSTVQVNGANRATTFVSATQLSASIPASDIAVAGNLSITTFNPAPGGGTSQALTLTVNNPVPSLSAVSPAAAIVGSSGFTLTVSGTNFVAGSTVQVNGANRATTFVSATQLNATIPASDIAVAGYLSITIFNPAPGGGTSPALTLTVNNPVPSPSVVSPASAIAGSSGFTLTVGGTNFVAGSTVQVNGANRTTTFVSATQLRASIPASDIAVAGYLSITIFNPAPGGGTSPALTLTVNNPVPSISSVSPNPAIALASSYTLTVTGAGFVRGSVIRIDGAQETTTFVSSTQITAQVNGGLLSIGEHTVTVFNPTPGGGTSNSVNLTVISILGQLTAPSTPAMDASVATAPEPLPSSMVEVFSSRS